MAGRPAEPSRVLVDSQEFDQFFHLQSGPIDYGREGSRVETTVCRNNDLGERIVPAHNHVAYAWSFSVETSTLQGPRLRKGSEATPIMRH